MKIAINGFGRIGRHAFKVMMDVADMEVVAVNDLTDNKTLAHLLQYDTAYPASDMDVSYDDEHLIVNGKKVPTYAQKDPSSLPWDELDVDVVLECTGFFLTKEAASMHLAAGAKRVVLSAPGKGEGISSFLRGINCETYTDETVIDNASCTTNCTAPVIQVLEDAFGIEKAMLSTIHSYTADQKLQDAPHKDLRRARAAAQNIVPTSTGAAIAVTKVIPALQEKFDGLAIRVPTITVSLVDITAVLKKNVSVKEVNAAFMDAAEGSLAGILAVSEDELVSSDFIGNPASSTVDLSLTNVVAGNLVKVIAWYDNEWGYANRLVEMAHIVGSSLV